MSTIPYDLTRIRAFVFDVDGVLSPNVVAVGPDGNPARMANVKDGYAMQLARKHGYRLAIISGADSETVRRRFELLGIEDVFMRVSDKRPVLESWMARNGLDPETVSYVGDDVPDIPCLDAVGLPVVPADASVDAKNHALYVSPLCGGMGIARELIEQTMRAQGEWLNLKTAFGW
ncbi:MAG: HAD hydrolase-like protein [Muribaculaceae bacterium]|nr:HAD hydrolase-like protein [Muribaculaceae bacterium]